MAHPAAERQPGVAHLPVTSVALAR